MALCMTWGLSHWIHSEIVDPPHQDRHPDDPHSDDQSRFGTSSGQAGLGITPVEEVTIAFAAYDVFSLAGSFQS